MSKVLSDVSFAVWNKISCHNFRNNRYVQDSKLVYIGNVFHFYVFNVVHTPSSQMFIVRIPFNIIVKEHQKKRLDLFLEKQFCNACEKLILGVRITERKIKEKYSLAFEPRKLSAPVNLFIPKFSNDSRLIN